MKCPLLKILLSLSLFLFVLSCQTGKDYEQQANKMATGSVRNPVDTIVLKKQFFKRELTSNGKLEALQRARLRFRVSDVLEKIHVKNGEKVYKGQVLATLNSTNLASNLEKAKLNLEKAKIEFQDVLIGHGYDPADTATIPDKFIHIAKIKTGLAEARVNLKDAQNKFLHHKLYAPFSGVVANIEKKPYDPVSSSEDFCTLINNERFHVRFSVMESELEEVKPDKSITIYPLSGGSYEGFISEINPVIDENGLLTIRGIVENSDGRLMEGMNVNLRIENAIPGQLVIPKSALALRQNREVVFTLEKDSIAIWNYVKSGFENSHSYLITEGLEEGDIVISEGNINLAHESVVYVQSDLN